LNKQQLAAKIWESANQMRSKIEANEYKDYILGFIFYKYLSDQEIQYAKKQGMSDAEIAHLREDDTETADYIRKDLGYFIPMTIYFQHGWQKAVILMSPACVMPYLPLSA